MTAISGADICSSGQHLRQLWPAIHGREELLHPRPGPDSVLWKLQWRRFVRRRYRLRFRFWIRLKLRYRRCPLGPMWWHRLHGTDNLRRRNLQGHQRVLQPVCCLKKPTHPSPSRTGRFGSKSIHSYCCGSAEDNDWLDIICIHVHILGSNINHRRLSIASTSLVPHDIDSSCFSNSEQTAFWFFDQVS